MGIGVSWFGGSGSGLVCHFKFRSLSFGLRGGKHIIAGITVNLCRKFLRAAPVEDLFPLLLSAVAAARREPKQGKSNDSEAVTGSACCLESVSRKTIRRRGGGGGGEAARGGGAAEASVV